MFCHHSNRSSYLTLSLESMLMVSGILWPKEHPKITKKMLQSAALAFRTWAKGKTHLHHGNRGDLFGYIDYDQLVLINRIADRMHLPKKWLADAITSVVNGDDTHKEKVVEFFSTLQSFANAYYNQGRCF